MICTLTYLSLDSFNLWLVLPKMQNKQVYKPIESLAIKKQIFTSSNKTRDIRLPQKIGLDVRNIIRLITLITSDLVAIALGWHVATGDLTQSFLFSSQWQDSQINLSLSSVLLLSIFLLSACQAYERGTNSRNPTNSSKAITLAHLALIPMTWELYGKHSLTQLFLAWLITLAFTSSCRFMIFQVLSYLRRKHRHWKIKVMVISEGEDLDKCIALLKKSQEFYIDTQIDLSNNDEYNQVVTGFERLNVKQIDEILICSWNTIKNSKRFLWQLRCSGIHWQVLEFDNSINQNNLEISQFEGITALRISDSLIMGINFLIKRIVDLTFSSILLLVLSLPMGAIAFLIKLDSPGSVFYKQTRVGLNGLRFQVWKFRTMVQDASQQQQQLEVKNEISGGVLFKIKNDPRVTKIGKYLRQYSLDELPQLFNVLRGEMSLVGPRPLPVRDVEKFSPEHYSRHEVLPGITGLWQVSGRSDTDSEQVFNLDFEYIQKWSLALDFEILLRTIGVVLNTKGAY